MKTKKIDITDFWEHKENEKIFVMVKKISFGDQNDILDQITNVTISGKKVDASPLYGRLKTLTLMKCILEAPFQVTEDYITKELDADLGDFIFEQIDNWNVLPDEKKEKSEVAGKI